MIDNIEIPTAILGFRPCLAQIKHFRFTLPYCYFRLSVIVSIIWMHFFELVMVGNPKNSHQNFDAIYCKRYKYFRFGGRIAISSCRSLTQSFEALSFNLSWSNPRIAVGISMLSIIVSEIYNYFRFGWPYCYFRLSVILAITFFELAMVENPQVQLETNTFVVLVLKLVGAFSYPQAQHMCVTIEAQYEG